MQGIIRIQSFHPKEKSSFLVIWIALSLSFHTRQTYKDIVSELLAQPFNPNNDYFLS